MALSGRGCGEELGAGVELSIVSGSVSLCGSLEPCDGGSAALPVPCWLECMAGKKSVRRHRAEEFYFVLVIWGVAGVVSSLRCLREEKGVQVSRLLPVMGQSCEVRRPSRSTASHIHHPELPTLGVLHFIECLHLEAPLSLLFFLCIGASFCSLHEACS